MMKRKELLTLFCSKDTPRFLEPFLWKNKVGATNGHIMLLLPARGNENLKQTTLGIEGVIPKPAKKPRQYSVKIIKNTLASIPKTAKRMRKRKKVIKDDDIYVAFDNIALFDRKYIEMLLMVADYEKVDEVTCISRQRPDTPWHFTCGVAEVLLMPMIGFDKSRLIVSISHIRKKGD